MGLVTAFEEWENNILGYQDDPAYGKGIILDIKAARAQARERMQKFDIRPANEQLKTANFSGGNQQKIVLAREMERDPDVLIVGQPTRGVDIGAIEFIHNQIIKMRDAGKAILLVSVELDEIRSLADRILVMFDGQHRRRSRPRHRHRRRTRPDDGRRARARGRPPQWSPADERPSPAAALGRYRPAAGDQPDAGLRRLRPRGLRHRAEPAGGARGDRHRRLRQRLQFRLHALLFDQLHLHRPRRGGRGACRACSTSAATARPISPGSG